MVEALTLTQERKNQGERLRDYRKILFREGVPGLTVEQLKEYTKLCWLEENGELIAGNPERALQSMGYKRIEEAKSNISRGMPPFRPSLTSWTWDPDKREFYWTGKEKPKDFLGDPAQLTFKLEGIEEPGRRL